MPHRTRPIVDPVEIFHDGTRVVAERGEPLAFALIAADRLPLARSPKLHRPRGPYCLRGGCDGCLARVDGVPDVMTCQHGARGGERIETQNVLGTRGVDALRAADFLFPKGIDHHRLFAGIRGVSEVVQTFARQVAGLGKLPDEAEPIRPAARRAVDVLVIGGGASGLGVAAALGERVLLVDDGPFIGGSQRALDPEQALRLEQAAREAGAELVSATMAIGLFREPPRDDERIRAVIVGTEGATLVEARVVVLACGAHDPMLAFGNNDLPGVVSARAALLLLRAGISLGQRIALVGSGRFADAFAEASPPDSRLARHGPATVSRAVGRSRVSGIVIATDQGERRERVDAVVVDGPGAPALELAVQAGAKAAFHREHGYVLGAARDGQLARGLFGVGSLLAGNAEPPPPAAVAGRVQESL